ncbi:MAG: tetratricopeptide repeat protein [bacterium]
MPRGIIGFYVLWLQRVAQTCAARGHHEIAISLFHTCLGWMQRMEDPKGEGIMHHNLGLVHQFKGDIRGAAVHYSRALSLEELAKDWTHMAQTLLALAGCQKELGDSEKARDTYNRAYLFAIQAEFPTAQAASCQYGAELAEDACDYVAALEHWARLMRIAEENDLQRMHTFAANQRARLHLETGLLSDAASEAEVALKLAETYRDTYNAGLAHATIGELCVKSQAWSRALHHLTQAERLLSKSAGKDRVRVQKGLEKAYRALGDEAEARRYGIIGQE